eukprot:5485086-Pyramimonas_sp.AAC.1
MTTAAISAGYTGFIPGYAVINLPTKGTTIHTGRPATDAEIKVRAMRFKILSTYHGSRWLKRPTRSTKFIADDSLILFVVTNAGGSVKARCCYKRVGVSGHIS